ncbi:putative hydroxypyruvate isomerase [Diorhabda carinulata]|uniref:putative hydroxypyruvate isomerase n=1 Tax=Diorhabda carinulata TaxID=1163345 RepID=UPI0025A296A9|nr:putative hydroxypyruvate isomerase [Diorhabda carinulata]
MLHIIPKFLNVPLNSSRNMSKFCANLAFLFPDKPLKERYQLAKNAGFKAVETGFPFGLEMQEVVAAKNTAGIEQILINIYTGDVSKGELGFAAIPGKEKEFKNSLEKTIEYAKALGVRKIHIMSGKVDENKNAHDILYESNLRYAAKMLEKENLIGLIEPINKYSIPNYYMNSYDKAVSVIEKINSPHLKLMLDIFHLQLIKGNITHTIHELKNHIGHVQIAQAPDRHEPTTEGEINYKYVLEILQREGYKDWIGLEYKPLKDTEEGLKWIQDLGYSL